MRDGIRFLLGNRLRELGAIDPTMTVLDYLRRVERRCGTKEGCAEGDCGACTVIVGEPVRGGKLALQTVNACIRFLPTLHGKALFTVEDLQASPSAALHPAQQAMVECHGSQCGFCTPGFVMSLWSTYEHHGACGTRPSRQELADDLSGNLCRCTGYRPILNAAQAMQALPMAHVDEAQVLSKLELLAHVPQAPEVNSLYISPRNLPALHEELVKAQPTFEQGDMNAALALATTMLGGGGTIYVFSDFQKSNWEAVRELPAGVACRLRPVTENPVDNIAIVGAELTPASPVAGETVEVVCTVFNCSGRPVEQSVRLELGETAQERRVVGDPQRDVTAQGVVGQEHLLR